ncbi:trypsin-like peptidase domain-containing protein [Cellulomonas soli]|uniref:S1C family serine protease n=1 Tax=Cellulomonas soli TaxID=931535 RepID=UPI003F83D2C1
MSENPVQGTPQQDQPTGDTQPVPTPAGATQPLPRMADTQPLDAQVAPAAPAAQQPPVTVTSHPVPPAGTHPTNPFLPPHPASPPELRAQHEARLAQQRAAQAAHTAAYGAPPQPAPVPGQQPYPYAQAAQPGAVPLQTIEPSGAPAKRRSIWLPVTTVGVVAALAASLGTAALTGAFADDSTQPSSLASLSTSTNESVPVAGSTSDDPDWEAVTTAVQASVVAIQVTTSSGTAEGSGVIIDTEGHVITNNHVVEGAEGDTVQVTLSDGRLFDATIVGTDPTTDLAVVQITDAPDDLSPATLGDSDAVTVGEAVMAVGNPLGLANTVTTGIVSALDRPVSTSESGSASDAVVTNAIQIDAAVNPGNSGGPLFDAEGKVIGITSSIATTSSDSGSIGIGFAIPVNLVSSVAAQLIESGSAEHAFLGVSLSDGTATADGVTRRGAVVEQVSSDSPASAAGLQKGDTIVAIGGRTVGGAESLTAYVRALSSGTKVTLTVVRDGAAIDVDVTLAAREETTDTSSGGSSGSVDPQDMTPEQLWEWFQQQQEQQGSGQ